jgi:hypothetical protein
MLCVSKVRGSSWDSNIIPLFRPPAQLACWFVWVGIDDGNLEPLLGHSLNVGSHVTSDRRYPFHKDKYWWRRRCRRESSIWSTSYSSPVVNSIGGGGGAWRSESCEAWWGSRRETWKTWWIWKCGGSSSRKAIRLMRSTIRNDPNFL